MPTAQSNGCPIHYEVEGPENKPVLMLCNSLGTTLHMWDGQMPARDAAFPRRALRPPRPRQVRRPRRPLQHGDARPRRARRARRRQGRQDQLVRPLDGRHGRHVARRQRAAARQPADPLQHVGLFREQADLERPHQDREGEGPAAQSSAARWSAGSPRASASASRRRCKQIADMFLATKPEATSPAARRCATWITARSSSRSRRRRW